MTLRPLAVALTLQLLAAPAFAQQAGFERRPPDRSRESTSGSEDRRERSRERTAQPRPSDDARRAPETRAEARPSAPPPRAEDRRRGRDGDRDRDDRGWGRGRRDRDDRVEVRRERGRPIIVAPSRPPVYVIRPPAYRYESRRWNRPYYRGGLAYFYYGGFGWYPRATYFADRGYFGRGYASDLGELRLRVSPRWADVYVDGFYAGTVDQFDGIFQSLKLESGPYLVEIVAPGYETLEVNVRISPGEKVTYSGELRREP